MDMFCVLFMKGYNIYKSIFPYMVVCQQFFPICQYELQIVVHVCKYLHTVQLVLCMFDVCRGLQWLARGSTPILQTEQCGIPKKGLV